MALKDRQEGSLTEVNGESPNDRDSHCQDNPHSYWHVLYKVESCFDERVSREETFILVTTISHSPYRCVEEIPYGEMVSRSLTDWVAAGTFTHCPTAREIDGVIPYE